MLLIENASRPAVIEYMGFLGLENDAKRQVLTHHELITNDINLTGSDDGDIDLFFDEDQDDDFMFTVYPADEGERPEEKEVDPNLVYGSDKDAVSSF